MTKATGRQPTLRCLSCGYDIASLVEQRGRDEPGVCPECGEDLRESLVARMGLPAQHEWSAKGHARFICDSLVHPRRTADLMVLSVVATGRIAMTNCVLTGLLVIVLAVGSAAAQGLFTGDFKLALFVVFYAPIVGIVVAIAVFMLMLLFSVALLAGSWLLRWRPTQNKVWGALDIGTAWLVLWPAAIPVGLVLSALAPTGASDAVGVALIVLLCGCPLLAALWACCAMSHFRERSETPPALINRPASEPPSPSNLT
jgi:hypothetical protein